MRTKKLHPRTDTWPYLQAPCHLLDSPSPRQVIAPMSQELWGLLLQSPLWALLSDALPRRQWLWWHLDHQDQSQWAASMSWRERAALLTQLRSCLPLSLSGDDIQGCILDHILETQQLSPERDVLCLCYKIPKGKLYMTRKWIIVHIFLCKTCMFGHHQGSTETTFERASEAQIHGL